MMSKFQALEERGQGDSVLVSSVKERSNIGVLTSEVYHKGVNTINTMQERKVLQSLSLASINIQNLSFNFSRP